jgi:two-component system CheB/CheR fusion protein
MAKKKGATTSEAPQSGTAEQPAEQTPKSITPAFPIVGIGASAGGLSAFEAFFSGMPADAKPGMAFVLVQHLAPDHKSILTDLIQRYTSMQVSEVSDGVVVQPNCAYIIPPNRDMAFLNGTLHLMEPSAPRGQRLPIDFFFRSLAQDQGERAIGVVLSGTGSDGTLGVRAIKGEGGMVMVQNPASTEYDGMPRSALSTGLVDYELPPAEMPAQIIAYVRHALGKPPRKAVGAPPETESALKKIFILLRSQTGHDFSQYKPSTIRRRIERRMAVHQVESITGYVRFLQQNSIEVEALFRDMLIGVTNFFRDPAAFKELEEKVIPELFANKPLGSTIRVWVPGCSTGEEAYSIAILLQERLDALKRNFKVNVFATDIDSTSIATARAGLYSGGIATDLTPERLARFFSTEPEGGYRIHKSIRDMLIFSEQDVIKDPPFSKLDLISCRNLLIYMGGELQKKVIPLFHYALSPRGYLFLGTSETVGDFVELFSVLDRKLKLYQRKEDMNGGRLPSIGRFVPPMTEEKEPLAPYAAAAGADSAKLSLRCLAEQAILQHVSTVGALVNAKGNILYLHGRSGLYLEPALGEVDVYNILKMAREGLRRELTTALHKATGTTEPVCCPGLRVKTNGDFTLVDLTVRAVVSETAKANLPPLYMVLLDAAQPSGHGQRATEPEALDEATQGPGNTDERILALKQELRAKDEYLQTSHEELETSNEELKSSNEEMQSVNEELQSTNEELETSKEELQSVNEELATVNAELQTKVADLSRANNDMNNLLAGTGIATIFVDHQLRILRFTPAATRIINLILSDIGRPVYHIVSNLEGYDTLMADTQAVLETLTSKEIEVQTVDGKWYTTLIRPYITLENVIEGAVITFYDITETKKSIALALQAQQQLRLATAVRDLSAAALALDDQGRITAWNAAAQRLYGWSEAEALAMTIRDMTPEELKAGEFEAIMLAAADDAQIYSTRRVAKNGQILNVRLTAATLVDEDGRTYGVVTTERAFSLKAEA